MIYIFDLDGTLADCEHRRHWLDTSKHLELTRAQCWERFFDPEEVAKDEPNWPVRNCATALQDHSNTIWIWSARPERLRKATTQWFYAYSMLVWPWSEEVEEENDMTLRMRPEGDFRPDHELKQEWLLALPEDVRRRIAAVFDDRQSVVDMWRRNGIRCFQVAPGNF